MVNWAEALTVYRVVLSSHAPKKVQNPIAHFLLLVTASKEVRGLGWLDYDKAFRKLAEDDHKANWGEASPTLWVTRPDILENYLADEFKANTITAPFIGPCFKGTQMNRY